MGNGKLGKIEIKQKMPTKCNFFYLGNEKELPENQGKIRNQTRIQSEKKINIYERIFSNLLVIFALGVFQLPIPWKESRILLHN